MQGVLLQLLVLLRRWCQRQADSPCSSAGVIAIVWWLRPEVYDYSRILNDSLLFYEAHRIGGAL